MVGQEVVGHIVVKYHAAVDLGFFLIDAEVMDELPQTVFLKERM